MGPTCILQGLRRTLEWAEWVEINSGGGGGGVSGVLHMLEKRSQVGLWVMLGNNGEVLCGV